MKKILLASLMASAMAFPAMAIAETVKPAEGNAVKSETVAPTKEHKKGKHRHHKMKEITVDEALTKAKDRSSAMFDKIDTEGKGVITKQQFVDSKVKQTEDWLKKADTNGDGVVSVDEQKEHMKNFRKDKKASDAGTVTETETEEVIEVE